MSLTRWALEAAKSSVMPPDVTCRRRRIVAVLPSSLTSWTVAAIEFTIAV